MRNRAWPEFFIWREFFFGWVGGWEGGREGQNMVQVRDSDYVDRYKYGQFPVNIILLLLK